MGILGAIAIQAVLAMVVLAWAGSLVRRGGRGRAARWCRRGAIAVLVAEVGAQAYAIYVVYGPVAGDSGSEKAYQLARGISIALNAGAVGILAQAVILAAVAGIALASRRRATT